MAIGAFNPRDNAGAVTTRPAHANQLAAGRRWFTDAGAGTRVHAQDLNFLLAQFRAAMDAVGLDDAEGDDEVLAKLLAASRQPGRNAVRNPSFNIWSGGTSFALSDGTATAIADVWSASGANGTASRQTGFSGARFCLRLQRTAGATSTTALRAIHQLPGSWARYLAGRQLTVTADVRAGANYSMGTIACRIQTGTAFGESVDSTGSFATGAANVLATADGAGAPTTTAARRTWYFSVPPDANANAMSVRFTAVPTGTAGANDFVELTNIKVEVGIGSTRFEPVDQFPSATLPSIEFVQAALDLKAPLEYGTFTPAVSFATPGTSSFAYSTQQGRYMKIGRLVQVSVALGFTPTIGTGSGVLQISAPLTSHAQDRGALSLYSHNENFTYPAGTTSLQPVIAPNTTQFLIYGAGSAVSTGFVGAGHMQTGQAHTLNFSGSYEAAA